MSQLSIINYHIQDFVNLAARWTADDSAASREWGHHLARLLEPSAQRSHQTWNLSPRKDVQAPSLGVPDDLKVQPKVRPLRFRHRDGAGEPVRYASSTRRIGPVPDRSSERSLQPSPPCPVPTGLLRRDALLPYAAGPPGSWAAFRSSVASPRLCEDRAAPSAGDVD